MEHRDDDKKKKTRKQKKSYRKFKKQMKNFTKRGGSLSKILGATAAKAKTKDAYDAPREDASYKGKVGISEYKLGSPMRGTGEFPEEKAQSRIKKKKKKNSNKSY